MQTTLTDVTITGTRVEPDSRYNGKCPGCGKHASVLGRRINATAKATYSPHLHHAVLLTSDGTAYEVHPAGHPVARCECGRALFLKRVAGKLNRAVVCNAKCHGATGHVCECSCGGKNHGMSHA